MCWRNIILNRPDWNRFNTWAKANGYNPVPSCAHGKVYVSIWLKENDLAKVNAWTVVNII